MHPHSHFTVSWRPVTIAAQVGDRNTHSRAVLVAHKVEQVVLGPAAADGGADVQDAGCCHAGPPSVWRVGRISNPAWCGRISNPAHSPSDRRRSIPNARPRLIQSSRPTNEDGVSHEAT